jgi:hypothetical protein
MTMLTSPDCRLEPVADQSRRDSANATTVARRAMLKRICFYILVGLLEGGVMAAGIALKTVAYFWRFPI